MNAVERLQAAIDKLERLKAENDTGHWTQAVRISEDPFLGVLYRMADPVIESLRSALNWLAEGNNAAIVEGSSIFAAQLGPEFALADAILGDAS